MEEKIYQILKKHRLPLKKREEILADLLLLFNVSGRSEQLCQHSWVKHPSHPKIGAMVCLRCDSVLA